jgi:PAS domain S-box-containing protein
VDKTTSVPEKLIREMRDRGRSLENTGMAEVDLSSGAITWVNNYLSEQVGMSIKDLCSMTVFDITPESLQDRTQEGVANRTAGRPSGYPVWASMTGDGKVAWWYTIQTKTSFPLHWVECELIQKTDPEGIPFSFMKFQMEITGRQSSTGTQIEELDKWVHEQVSRQDTDLAEMGRKLDAAVKLVRSSADAALASRNASMALQVEVNDKLKEFDDALTDHTTEILRLIGTDQVHDKRIEAFEKHVKKTTDLAIKSITMQADKAGQGLSKRVTIPVSVIAAVATLVQYLIQNWDKVGGFLG